MLQPQDNTLASIHPCSEAILILIVVLLGGKAFDLGAFFFRTVPGIQLGRSSLRRQFDESRDSSERRRASSTFDVQSA